MGSNDEATPVQLADPARSRAVLIGASTYEHLGDLPAVATGLEELRNLLLDPQIWGLPEENCLVIGQDQLTGPNSLTVVLRAIHEAADAAQDSLLIYYAGHGLHDPANGKLRLALPHSNRQHRFTSLAFDDVRQELAAAQRTHRLVILDCCYAGLALSDGMGATAGTSARALSEYATLPDSYLIAAAASNEEAIAPRGEKYTAFSGELIRALKNGVSDGPELWDVRSLFNRMRGALVDKGRPLPELLDRTSGSALHFAKNVGFGPLRKLPEPLVELLRAQVRASDSFAYRLVGAHRSMVDVYVRQKIRELSNKPKDQAKKPLQPEIAPPRRVEDVLADFDHIIVLGGPGLGKSTQSVQLAAQIAGAWLSGGAIPPAKRLVPLRVIASTLAAAGGTFESALVKAAQVGLGMAADSDLPANLLNLIPAGFQWLILVDGLDEVADTQLRHKLIDVLRSRMKPAGSDLRIVIFTRPLALEELSNSVKPEAQYVLQPFDIVHLSEFAMAWFEGHDVSAEEFLDQVHSASLHELVRVPLLATIAAIAYEAQPDRPLPSNRYGLYEQYLRYLATEKAEEAYTQWQELQRRLSLHSSRDHIAAESLFQQRMLLAGKLADAVADGEVDLMSVAIQWLSNETGLQISAVAEWRKYVASALNSLGIFAYENGKLMFTHASFGDHLVANAWARRLPIQYDLGAAAWHEVTSQALSGVGNGLAALVHYSYMHPTGHSLLDEMQNGSREEKLLTGMLLAEGVPSKPCHIESFVTALKETVQSARNNEPASAYTPWFSVAGRLSSQPVISYLREIVRDSPDRGIRLQAAIALSRTDRPLAISVLRSFIDGTPKASPDSYARAAAGALFDLAPEYMPEVLRAYLDSNDLRAMPTTNLLRGLPSQQAAEIFDILRARLSDESTRVQYGAATVIIRTNTEDIDSVIETLIRNGGPGAWIAIRENMPSLAPDHWSSAARTVAKLASDPDPEVREATVRYCAEWIPTELRMPLLSEDRSVRNKAMEILNKWLPR